MAENTFKLFDLCNKTLGMMADGLISEKAGNTVLDTLIEEIDDKKSLYPSLAHLCEYETKFWYKNFFKTQEEVLEYLHITAQAPWRSARIMNHIVEDFLQMPMEIKRNFYETNLVDIVITSLSPNGYVQICGKKFVEADIHNTFHNLPTMFLMSRTLEDNYDVFERICDDFKETRGMSQSEFLDLHGTSLIHCLPPEYILRNWNQLEIDKRRDLQEIFGTKLYERGTVKNRDFLSYVDNDILPHDLQLPRSRTYLMNEVIIKELELVISCVGKYPFNSVLLIKNVNEVIEFMKDLNSKYDLSMFSFDMWIEKRNELSNEFAQFRGNVPKEVKGAIEAEILNFTLEIEDVLTNRKDQIKKKIKI